MHRDLRTSTAARKIFTSSGRRWRTFIAIKRPHEHGRCGTERPISGFSHDWELASSNQPGQPTSVTRIVSSASARRDQARRHGGGALVDNTMRSLG